MIRRFLKNFDEITEYYEFLVNKTKNLQYVGITNEWLIDNYYLLVEHKKRLLRDEKIMKKNLKKASTIENALRKIIIRNSYHVDFKKITTGLNLYQKENKYYFSYDEINLIPTLLLFLYTIKLKEICDVEYQRLVHKEKVSYMITKIKNKEISLEEFLEHNSEMLKDENYLFELNNQLRELGTNSNQIFKILNSRLEENHINLKEVINQEYQKRMDNNILVSNIFNNLKKFGDYTQEDLFEQISYTEKKLLKDDIYRKMTEESKAYYRFLICKYAKRKKISEYAYVCQFYETNPEEHIGTYLIRPKKYRLRFTIYFISLLLLSVISSYIGSIFFIKNQILGFILLLIPIFNLWAQIINHLLMSFVTPRPLPKLDFSKGIPEEYATMVVIPTIISDTEKIKKLFDCLETFYIVNKTKNLYFTLLGDAKAIDQEHYEKDEEISEFGVEYARKLNQKYKQNIFHFVYRKRFYNEKENCYLGYERKRGAIHHFNQLLLHQFTKKEAKKYFHVHTLEDFQVDIRYVITLDTDTDLVLNTALNLVGAIAHPLNHPVLNKTKTKVISGYALMQPRVSVDIESTNQSFYSQIFANIGGFDSYTAIVPNVYFDSFGEGSFIGKGIYDLKVFDEVLSKAFPDNLVLSHDLLEGNYLRCAYVADVELIEGFPPKFLTDTTRQHRWARGDVQIFQWLFPRVYNKENVKVKNPLNFLEKFKIFDNIMRMFLQPMLFIILILALFFGKVAPIFWILFVSLEIILPIFFYLKSKMYHKKQDVQTIYYKELMVGGKSLVLRSYALLATIPYYTCLYLDAFFRTIYRLFISHKNLLNWITAEDAEKTLKFDLKTYLQNFWLNLLTACVLIVVGFLTLNIYSVCIGLIFFSAPFIMYGLSQPLESNLEDLSLEKRENMKGVARRTWQFFQDQLTKENNYLIPDNYQENREDKSDFRTSPTDIGFSLTSVLCAYFLEFIEKEEAIAFIEKIITTVDSLEKWNGHLYNWYHIKTKEVLEPRFISTVDSGNFVASLMVVNQFLLENGEEKLARVVERLIKNANFKKLYTKKEVFSIGYQEKEAMLSVYNYNKFASESRLTSFIAIAKGDVPSNHWFCLDKSLTSFNHAKGLTSWSGTSFEYYMPYLFMKNYPHTLLDESYHFAYMCQKAYVESINHKLPWGMSESAYDELDNANSYKYQAFSTPYLKVKEEKNPRIVLSPYSSLMAFPLFPEEVYKNMMRFRKLDMYGEYGFYESYDTETEKPVLSYYAHHQGMSLIGLTNYLMEGIIQNYFHKDIRVQTFDILLKEKVQVKTDIDLKIAKYKKYNYQKEKIENDIRTFPYISDMPEVSVLSNKKYCLLMNDRGDGFSRYRTIQLNRYRKITEQDYGVFLYIRNMDTNQVISNTYAPMNQMPEKYEVIFASDKIKYIRTDEHLTTTTEIVVTKEHHAEIRRITFQNQGEEDLNLELTTYLEPIICENMEDVSHRVFNNMFLKTYYDSHTDSLISMRKKKNESSTNAYYIHHLLIEDHEKPNTYETSRENFFGRNHNASNPEGLYKRLSNQDNEGLEPIMSLRNQITVKAGGKKVVYIINGFGRSKEQIYSIVRSYHDFLSIQKAFEVSTLMNIENTKLMNLTGEEMRLYNIMLNYLYQTTKITVNEERKEFLRKNALSQSGLWKFGVSGDYPTIVVDINDIVDIPFIRDILKCFEYYKNHSIFVDIVIINSENDQYAEKIKKEIADEIYRMYTLNNFYHTPGKIVVIDRKDMTEEERRLFDVVPRLRFVLNDHKSLSEKVELLQEQNEIAKKIIPPVQQTTSRIDEPLIFETDFGGFTKDGREYVVKSKNTPMPWANIIANEKMGSVISNNGCGFTYAYNSGEFKITSWTNDMIVNDKSEGFKINGEIFDPASCRHGFGYSILEGEYQNLKEEVLEFIPLKDSVKVYLVKLSNLSDKTKKIDLSFWMNPTFGNFEEKTARHILSEYQKEENYLKIRNVYSNYFSHVTAFMSSSLKLTHAVDDKVLIKEIHTEVSLKPGEEKEVVFTLGVSNHMEEFTKLLKEYNDVSFCKKKLEEVKDYYRKTLSMIQVKTEDSSFDTMINGWYLYQCLVSRILSRTGFYQVSGAYGYRDQLQDTMNICDIFPHLAREQILKNAAHQFQQGDVLHWWHDMNQFGLRSRYKDDYLWLVYATCVYISKTGDAEILKEKVPYVLGDELLASEVEKGMVFTYSDFKEPLLNHLLKSLNLAMHSLGEHGLPLMGGGDWNDGMNKVGVKGHGESVWLGFFLYRVIDWFIDLIDKEKLKIDKEEYQKFNENLKKNLNQYAYDGSYYLRAFFDNGDKLGSSENEECKIDLISQSFAILSGVVPKNRVASLLKSVRENLVDRDALLVKLLTPPFEKSSNNPGYIMNYPKGIRENGGQYTHAVSWYLMALIQEGKYDEAYQYFQMINPIERTKTNEQTRIYKVEPYVIAADIYTHEKHKGRGGWTWYTGSAGWFYQVAIHDILGFVKEGEYLKIEPHLPKDFQGYRMNYHFFDTEYHISLKRGEKRAILLDGKIRKEKIPLVNDRKKHKIEVVIC